jgi:hypothetical protein
MGESVKWHTLEIVKHDNSFIIKPLANLGLKGTILKNNCSLKMHKLLLVVFVEPKK